MRQMRARITGSGGRLEEASIHLSGTETVEKSSNNFQRGEKETYRLSCSLNVTGLSYIRTRLQIYTPDGADGLPGTDALRLDWMCVRERASGKSFLLSGTIPPLGDGLIDEGSPTVTFDLPALGHFDQSGLQTTRLFQILFETEDASNAGSNDTFFVTLFDSAGISCDTIRIVDPELKRGQTTGITVNTSVSLGPVTCLAVSKNGTNGWNPSGMKVQSLNQNGIPFHTSVFAVNHPLDGYERARMLTAY